MARFTLPRDIYHGKDSLKVLKSLEGKKAFIVIGGGSMKRFGFLDKVLSYLKEANMETKVFEGVEPDPSVETVMKGAKEMEEFNPDWIVSIGGGSPIDAAKAMWIFYEYPDFTFEKAIVPFGLPKLRRKAKFVAIPSTSGTATEVTAFSVITDYKAKIKYPLADFEITPDIAIVDPSLAETMPEKLVAHTGMDALTHAIEAYTASLRSNFTDPLALKAIEMVNMHLVNSYKGDMEARGEMHEAQCLAGMAFSNALLGIVHSMAHKVGAVFHIPHGCANAIFLPYVIKYNRKACEDRYANIARHIGLKGESERELTDALIDLINKFNKELNIPSSMKEYGIEEDDFKANLKFIAHNAVLDPCTGSNPREIDDETMEKLYTCAYYGSDVDF
ncbi:iron-containing alcohol dehydrogenase [Clostridium perfringens]|uniref:NADPH-dependent butanol dehydrogenase n=1 Tax=Clostridium perfringens D str. JGS1721 TaxID=488537 RepID=B1UZK8_CLOPF|nr:iron-containing alcohol dehydrogenase [Clostridium perfringens]EDT73002.1 NADPH-dependent butanol dehydrogenase [Clostridium perfringens D str. JGS1721]EHK2400035.1 iron-containing alcohol dehydrogenase [Clostridium perfringens]MDK0839339.1 iron-containing alcohol dehydrogenase [Clostridium perfringens]MDM0915987.1 iron-containing alcohol dehydrogenase [Clostridium perfringens]MDM0947790.1 iron-containing alcohol dehydrogenase [Clostridium perfringens]